MITCVHATTGMGVCLLCAQAEIDRAVVEADTMAALHAKLEQVTRERDAFEEREASCCPEDVGCDEYIRALLHQIDTTERAHHQEKERADAAEARVRELEQNPHAQWGIFPCDYCGTTHSATHYSDGKGHNGWMECDLKADRDRLRGMWEKLREFMDLLKTEGDDEQVPAMWAAGWTGCREAVAQKMDALERGE